MKKFKEGEVLLKITALPEADTLKMRMIPTQAIASVMSDMPATARAYILPRGAALLPV